MTSKVEPAADYSTVDRKNLGSRLWFWWAEKQRAKRRNSIKNGEIFWMNNKAIIEFGFRRIWRILQISESVIHLGLRPRWITPSLICRILPHSIIANYTRCATHSFISSPPLPSKLVVRAGHETPTSRFQFQCPNHSATLKRINNPFMLSSQLVMIHWEWRTDLLQTAKSQLPALNLIETRVSNQLTADWITGPLEQWAGHGVREHQTNPSIFK